MRWQAYLTNDQFHATLTSQQLDEDPKHFKKWFADLNNPTDEEVATYFRNHFATMSDEWEIPINGNFRIDKSGDGPDALPTGTVHTFDDQATFKRLDVNKVYVQIGDVKFLLEAAAPIRVRTVEEEPEATNIKPLSSDELDPPYENVEDEDDEDD